MLNSNVLVLNRSYMPIHVTSVRRAFSLIYQEAARAVDEQYQTFDFESWVQLEVVREMDWNVRRTHSHSKSDRARDL